MKCPQTKFHTHAMRESEVIRSKFSCSRVFSLFIDTLLKLQQHKQQWKWQTCCFLSLY